MAYNRRTLDDCLASTEQNGDRLTARLQMGPAAYLLPLGHRRRDLGITGMLGVTGPLSRPCAAPLRVAPVSPGFPRHFGVSGGFLAGNQRLSKLDGQGFAVGKNGVCPDSEMSAGSFRVSL